MSPEEKEQHIPGRYSLSLTREARLEMALTKVKHRLEVLQLMSCYQQEENPTITAKELAQTVTVLANHALNELEEALK